MRYKSTLLLLFLQDKKLMLQRGAEHKFIYYDIEMERALQLAETIMACDATRMGTTAAERRQ